jgi:hypothetical protein
MAKVPRSNVGQSSKFGRFGVPRPEKLDYNVPMLRGWDFVNEKWTTDIREISSFKKTLMSFWTGALDWLGNPIYVYDLVNQPYSTSEKIVDVIYIVLASREDINRNLNDLYGGNGFLLRSTEQPIASWSGSMVEIVGDCFSMPDNPAVIMSSKLIHISKVKDGRII